VGQPLRPLRDVVEEADDASLEQRRGALVVARQAAISEQVLMAGVQEQLRAFYRLDDFAGDVEIALGDHQLVGVHRVDLERDTRAA
jgi:hypothetical protein